MLPVCGGHLRLLLQRTFTSLFVYMIQSISSCRSSTQVEAEVSQSLTRSISPFMVFSDYVCTECGWNRCFLSSAVSPSKPKFHKCRYSQFWRLNISISFTPFIFDLKPRSHVSCFGFCSSSSQPSRSLYSLTQPSVTALCQLTRRLLAREVPVCLRGNVMTHDVCSSANSDCHMFKITQELGRFAQRVFSNYIFMHSEETCLLHRISHTSYDFNVKCHGDSPCWSDVCSLLSCSGYANSKLLTNNKQPPSI